MLGEAGSLSGSPVAVFIDGLDLMENTYLPSTMEWLPNPVPKVCLHCKSNTILNHKVNGPCSIVLLYSTLTV